MFYIDFLEEILSRRKKVNPRYSLRAFAKNIDIDVGQLSKVLNKEAPLSVKAAGRIAETLRLDAEERRSFITSVADDQKCWALYSVDPDLTDCDQ